MGINNWKSIYIIRIFIISFPSIIILTISIIDTGLPYYDHLYILSHITNPELDCLPFVFVAKHLDKKVLFK